MKLKQILITTSVLGLLCNSAMADDSSITIYGRADAAAGRDAGSNVTGLRQGKGSLFGIKGNEDLGDGNLVFFDLQSTVFLQNGSVGVTGNGTSTLPNQNLLFDSDSILGIGNRYGWIDAGRKLTPAWVLSINADPWETYSYVTRNNAGLHANHLFTSARMSNAISANYKYDGWFASAMFGQAEANVAFANPPTGFAGTGVAVNAAGFLPMTGQRPESFAVGYDKGPLYFGVGYEQTPYNSSMVDATIKYNFDSVLLRAGIETGSHKNDQTGVEDVKATNAIIGATIPYGQGQLMFSYDVLTTKVLSANGSGLVTYNAYPWQSRKLGAGYQYFLSKRTFAYVDVVHDSKALIGQTGWDVGICHHF